MRDEEKDFCDSATPRTVHSYCRLCIVPNWKYSSVYPQLSWRTHLVCRGATRDSSQANFETKTEVLKDTSTPEWQSGTPTTATQAWTQDQDQDPSLPLQCSRAGRKPPPPSFPTLSVSLNLPPTITLGPAWRTPNQIYQPHATLA
jgi:hypothetical protein